jgi:streptogramin lyase/two-component sensor histidine kinase
MGLSCFNGKTFKNIGTREGIPSNKVSHIQEDKTGNILFWTGNYFCKYDGKKITSDTANIEPLKLIFYIDKTSTLWTINAKTHHLYYSKDYKKWKKLKFKNEEFNKKLWFGFDYDKINHSLILKDSTQHQMDLDDKISIFSHKYKYDIKTGIVQLENSDIGKRFINIAEKDYFIKSTGKIKTYIYRDGKIYYIKMLGKDLLSYNLHTRIIDTIKLKSTGITDILEDKSKNVWLATDDGLLQVFVDGIQNFTNEQLGYPWGIVEDEHGSMWFGDYYTHRLRSYDGTKIKEHKINYTLGSDLAKGDLQDFYYGGSRDKKGNLYFSSRVGVIKWDKSKFSIIPSYTVISYKAKADNNHDISVNHYMDSTQNILLSCTKGGFNVIDLEYGNKKYYSSSEGINVLNYTKDITKDKDGNYWILYDNGVIIYSLKNQKVVKEYSHNNGTFPYFGNVSIHCDINGNIWIGSSNGLLYFNKNKHKFELVASNYIKTQVNAVVGYKDKYIICTAIDGLYFIDLATYTNERKLIIKCYNQYNGFMGIQSNQENLYVDSKGYVWVASNNMVSKINPNELNLDVQPIHPYITQINNENVSFEDYTKIIKLPFGINTAKIFFEAVGFQRPFNAEYSYKINNSMWTPWRQEEFAVIENLPSSVHFFYLRTRPSGTTDVTEIEETKIQFEVDIPFYRETYFPIITLMSLVLLGMGAWYYLWRQKRIGKEKVRKQKEIDKERNLRMQYLEVQTLQSQLNPHFIFNVLQTIQTRIYENDRKSAGKLIVDLGNLIRRFLESSLFMGLDKLRNSEITLIQEIDLLRSYIEFEQLQYTNRFGFEIIVQKDLDIENIQVPPMLIQPYVENAIKHGILYERNRFCNLEVSFVKTNDNVLICRISDDGVGRPRAKMMQDASIQMYKSRGTQILEERIEIMQNLEYGISVETMDNPKGGTIVQLRIDI